MGASPNDEPRTYSVLFTPAANRDLRRLDPQIQRRVTNALAGFEEPGAQPETGTSIKALRGELAGLHRLRIQDVRVVYTIEGGELLILVVLIGHRRDVYERATRRLT